MRKKLLAVSIIMTAIITVTLLVSCSGYDPSLPFYDMNIYDLSTDEDADGKPIIPENVPEQYQYLYDRIDVAVPNEKVDIFGDNREYLGHPDTVLLDDGTILCAFPIGHGKGETLIYASKDGGKTWSGDYTNPLPETFKYTEETPTIYKLDFSNGDQKLLMASGRPGWGRKGEGIDVSISESKGANGKCDGKEWKPHKNYWSDHAEEGYKMKDGKCEAIVAFASLTQLYENGKPIDKWMGIFHDYGFNVYKTYLTFDSNGEMVWTKPARVIDDQYRKIEKSHQFCEPEVVRSPDKSELAMIFRVNKKDCYSHVIFSTDEGNTWSEPQELSRELTGERHKAEYDPVTGKLIITFRAINWKVGQERKRNCWFSRGLVAWVGEYDDLHKGNDAKGDFLIKLAHTYLDGQVDPETSANGDTGYCGLTIDAGGNVVVTSYGIFSPYDSKEKAGKTYIIAKHFTLKDITEHFGITMR